MVTELIPPQHPQTCVNEILSESETAAAVARLQDDCGIESIKNFKRNRSQADEGDTSEDL